MRTIYMSLSALVLVLGCQSATDKDQPKPYPINVDFQTGFNTDSAIILIDNLFAVSVDSITTDPIIVLAASRRFTLIPATHTLSILLPKDTVRTDTTFVHLNTELWIGVNYLRNERRIHFVFQYVAFPYR